MEHDFFFFFFGGVEPWNEMVIMELTLIGLEKKIDHGISNYHSIMFELFLHLWSAFVRRDCSPPFLSPGFCRIMEM